MKTISSFRSKLFALTLAITASVASFAYEFEYVNDFHIDGFGYKIISVNTPDDGEGYVSLIEIADCKKDVVIPKYVSYGDRGFHVTTFGIGSVVFTNDASSVVESITIPKTTSVINKNALAGCPNLKTVVVDSENPYYDSRENCNAIITTSQNPYFTPNTLIAGCKTTLIPNSVVEIGENAFYDCESLETITIPNSVTKIGKSAFNVCSTLSSITLSENLTEIGNWAFDDCNNLKEVICYAPQPPTISKYTFSDISPTIYVPENTVTIYQNAPYWMTFDIQPIQPSYKSQWCNQWNILEYNVSGMGIPEETWRYYLAEDITINGTTYTTVNRYWTADKTKCGSVATIRFTENQKVYALLGDTEYLVYDFSVQVGDTIETIVGVNYGTMLQQLLVHQIDIAMPTGPKTITLYPICKMEDGECDDCDEDGHYLWECCPIEWIEGIGSTDGFLMGYPPCGHVGGIGHKLLCAYKDDELQYINELYQDDYGCEYNAGPFNEKLLGTWRVVGGNEIISISDSIIVFKYLGLTQKYTASATQLTVERLWIPEEESYRWANCNYTLSNDTLWIDNFMPLLVATYPPTFGPITLVKVKHEDLFPTLWGLQRTVYNEYCGDTEDDNSANFTYKQTFDSIFFENDKPYILCNGYLLREEDNKIFLYSQSLNKDIVLYDFTLEVGDSLPAYIKDFDGTMYSDDTLVVTDISSVTLLDGKEYKKWTFDNGMEYVEGIGMYGGHRNGNFFGLIQEIVVPCHTGTHLVCVSKNNKLLYQMDDAEMERLGAECLCEYNSGPKKDNAKNGKIGGRPTPTQWNMLEVETKEMDGTPTILRAETFSYTLENDSIVTKGKTFYQLARQSTKDTAITKSFVGALHFGEDEDNRVYFLRDGHEYVLYDFTAEPGDTIEIFAGINNYPQETTYSHVVTGKDTLENGACRMMLEVVFPEEIGSDLEQQHLQKVWLAGLGSIDGIVHNAAKRTSDAHAAPAKSASSETQSSVMLCAWREDSCLYTTNHPEYDTFGCVYNQDPTAVENLTSPFSYQKIIHEGTLLILHEGKVYNVIGIQIK